MHGLDDIAEDPLAALGCHLEVLVHEVAHRDAVVVVLIVRFVRVLELQQLLLRRPTHFGRRFSLRLIAFRVIEHIDQVFLLLLLRGMRSSLPFFRLFLVHQMPSCLFCPPKLNLPYRLLQSLKCSSIFR